MGPKFNDKCSSKTKKEDTDRREGDVKMKIDIGVMCISQGMLRIAGSH